MSENQELQRGGMVSPGQVVDFSACDLRLEVVKRELNQGALRGSQGAAMGELDLTEAIEAAVRAAAPIIERAVRERDGICGDLAPTLLPPGTGLVEAPNILDPELPPMRWALRSRILAAGEGIEVGDG